VPINLRALSAGDRAWAVRNLVPYLGYSSCLCSCKTRRRKLIGIVFVPSLLYKTIPVFVRRTPLPERQRVNMLRDFLDSFGVALQA